MPDITLSADIHSFMQAANAAAARAVLSVARLGENTFPAAQFIDGSADAVQLTIQGHSTQTNNILLIEKSDGTDLFTVSNTGLVNISTSGAAKLRFTDTATSRSFYIQQQSYISKLVNETSGGVMHFVDGSTNAYLKLESGYQAVFTQQGISFTSSSNALGTEDVFLTRKAAATLQLGLDANGVTNQMLTAASRITSDGVGANLTIAGGNGRGGAGGSLIFSTYTTAAAATIGTLTTRLTLDTAGLLTFADAVDMAFNATTGTKIGTATTQKIGFWNATPVVQQVLATGGGATVDNVISLLQTLGLCKQS